MSPSETDLQHRRRCADGAGEVRYAEPPAPELEAEVRALHARLHGVAS